MYFIKNIRRIRRFLTQSATKNIVHAYVISRLDFSNSLLSGISCSLLKRLQSVQNASARLIFQASRYDDASPLLQSLHWLPIKQRIDFKILVFTHNSLHGKALDYLSDLLVWRSTKRALRHDGPFYLREHRTQNRFGDRAFVNYVPRLWNTLPQSIRSISTIAAFKKALKTHFFRNAFS